MEVGKFLPPSFAIVLFRGAVDASEDTEWPEKAECQSSRFVIENATLYERFRKNGAHVAVFQYETDGERLSVSVNCDGYPALGDHPIRSIGTLAYFNGNGVNYIISFSL